MRTRLAIAATAILTTTLVAACGPQPPGPTSTTTTTEAPPVAPPEAPLMLTEPVGATAAISAVRGTGVIDGIYLSDATTSRLLDPEDLEDFELLLEAAAQVDPASGRWVRPSGEAEDDDPLEVCDAVAEDPVCEPIPGTEGYRSPVFSPDGTKLAATGYDFGLDETTVAIFDSSSLGEIASVSSSTIVTNPLGLSWAPDSTAIAFVLDHSIVTLAAAPGATPEVVASQELVGNELRDPVFVVGWSTQNRIVSFWQRIDVPNWPPAASTFVHSVAPDGSDARDLGPIEPLGFGTLAPDGSLVWPERRQVTDGTDTAVGSAPIAVADAAVPSRQQLSTPWSGTGPLGFRASETWVYGFVDLP